MIATIDLISPELHRRRRLHVRLRAYAAALVVVVAVMGVAGLHASHRAGQVKELNQVAAKLSAAEAKLRREGAHLLTELARTQKLLQEAERLREGHRWSRLLNYLAARVPDSVVLVMVSTDPLEPSTGSRLRQRFDQSGKRQGPRDAGPRALAIRGYALEHQDLAAFLRELNKGGVFDSVSLLHSKREPFLRDEGLAFTVTCHW